MFHEQNIELTIYRDDIMTAHEPDYAITCDHETCLVKSYFPEFTDVPAVSTLDLFFLSSWVSAARSAWLLLSDKI